MTCAEFSDRLEEYVSGELPPDERLAMDDHARLCLRCGGTLQELEEGAALLWLALPQIEPPPALRQRILTVVRHGREPERSATPENSHVLLPRPPAAAPARRAAWRRVRPSLAQVAAILSAASLVLTLGLAGWTVTLQDAVARQATENASLARQLGRQRDAIYVLMSPTRIESTLTGSDQAPQARGRVVLDPPRRQGMLVANDLPRLAPGQAYQVWLRGPQGVTSAGLLRIDERGTGYLVIDAGADEFESVGISLEPASGSYQPTGPRMMLGWLKQ